MAKTPVPSPKTAPSKTPMPSPKTAPSKTLNASRWSPSPSIETCGPSKDVPTPSTSTNTSVRLSGLSQEDRELGFKPLTSSRWNSTSSEETRSSSKTIPAKAPKNANTHNQEAVLSQKDRENGFKSSNTSKWSSASTGETRSFPNVMALGVPNGGDAKIRLAVLSQEDLEAGFKPLSSSRWSSAPSVEARSSSQTMPSRASNGANTNNQPGVLSQKKDHEYRSKPLSTSSNTAPSQTPDNLNANYRPKVPLQQRKFDHGLNRLSASRWASASDNGSSGSINATSSKKHNDSGLSIRVSTISSEQQPKSSSKTMTAHNVISEPNSKISGSSDVTTLQKLHDAVDVKKMAVILWTPGREYGPTLNSSNSPGENPNHITSHHALHFSDLKGWEKLDQFVIPSFCFISKLLYRATVPSSYHLPVVIHRKQPQTTSHLPNIFRKAAALFNSYGPSRYDWVRCIPSPFTHRGQDKLGVLAALQKAKIIWSESTVSSPSHLQVPSELLHIPSKYRDSQGIPFLDIARLSKLQELSRQYQDIDIPTLSRLGVRILDDDLFASMLSRVDMAEQSASWHGELAEMLLDGFSISSLSTLELIPLEYPNADWVSAQASTRIIYLPSDSILGPLPTGIDMSVIDSSASSNPSRLELFMRLGAAVLGPGQIRTQILELHHHRNRAHLAQTRTVSDIVSHAKFLFRNRDRRQPEEVSSQLFFPDHESKDCSLELYRGKKLYCQADDPITKFSPSRSLGVCTSIKYVHPDYLVEKGHYKFNKVEWLNWLHHQAGLAYFPRLFDIKGETVTKASYALLEWIVNASVERLAIDLANYWDSFGVLVSQNKEANDAVRLRLGRFILPLSNFETSDLGIFKKLFLDITVPAEKMDSFKKLEAFGLRTIPGTQLYLQLLQYASQGGNVAPVPTVHAIYRKLQQVPKSEEQMIREFFGKRKVIWVTRESPSISSWTPLDSCVWNGEPGLKIHRRLSDLYPDCEKLFCRILNILRNPSLDMLVEEAKYLAEGDLTFPAAHVKPVLFELVRHTRQCDDKDEWEQKMRCWSPLDEMAIFPVKFPGEAEARLVSRHEQFFVPDCSEHWELFKGTLPTLDVSVEEAEALCPLLNGFGGSITGISQAVKHDWIAKGKERLDVGWTMKIQSKIPEILRLICHYYPSLMTSRQDDVLRCLTTSCVIKAEEIERTSTVTYQKRASNQTMKVSASTPTNLCMMGSDKGFVIYTSQYKKAAETAIHYELPALLTRFLGLDEVEGAASLIENIIRLGREQAVAILDDAGITRLPDRLAQRAFRADKMPAPRPLCDGEAQWLWAAWVKKEALGIEPEERWHDPRYCICPRKRFYGQKTFTLDATWAVGSIAVQDVEGLSDLLAACRRRGT